MAFFIGIFGLFLLACLAYWWARGGVVPAIMLSLPLAAYLLVLHDAASNGDDITGFVRGPVVLLALAWVPCALRQCREGAAAKTQAFSAGATVPRSRSGSA